MNVQKVVTQTKRELWEHKVGFVYAPLLVSALLLLIISYAAFKFDGSVSNFNMDINLNFDGEGLNTNQSQRSVSKQYSTENVLEMVSSDGVKVYKNIVLGVAYVNTSLLYITFFIVLLAYAHSCLFDDRKNRDILFWRSMPVSETMNVLVKLAFLMLYLPVVVLLLNIAVAVFSVMVATLYFVIHGVSITHLLDLVFHSKGLSTIFNIFGLSVLDMALFAPVTGFILLASAYAKKSPFVTTTLVPVILMMLDKILQYFVGINLHIIDAIRGYSRLVMDTRTAFQMDQVLVLNGSTMADYAILLVLTVIFVSGAIWLRNHRYEI